jgi:hypothetical protein
MIYRRRRKRMPRRAHLTTDRNARRQLKIRTHAFARIHFPDGVEGPRGLLK